MNRHLAFVEFYIELASLCNGLWKGEGQRKYMISRVERTEPCLCLTLFLIHSRSVGTNISTEIILTTSIFAQWLILWSNFEHKNTASSSSLDLCLTFNGSVLYPPNRIRSKKLWDFSLFPSALILIREKYRSI